MSAARPFLIPMLAVAVFAATLGWFGYRSMTNRPAIGGGSATASTPSTLPTIPEKTAIAPSPVGPGDPAGIPVLPAAAAPVVPAFDVVRVEPTGEAVIAGRASPGATVELLGNGTRRSRVVADPSGLFALVPEALPPGDHELVLQIANADGTKVRSAQSVTVVVAPGGRTVPLVTVTAPGQPAVVLSHPDAPSGDGTSVAGVKPPSTPTAPGSTPARTAASGSQGKATRPAVQILTVETEGAGKLLVSAGAAPTANIRLYLNETFVAPASAGKDGRVAFAIERGMQPGSYKIRLDDVDPVSGEVRSRAEVPFVMPRQVAETGPTQPLVPPSRAASSSARAGGQSVRSRTEAEAPSTDGAKVASADIGVAAPDAPPTVVIPRINTAVVSRGDSLWAISKKTYGAGLRYTVIYGANTTQIRDPNLIYPGQLFVLPANGPDTASR